LKRGRALTGKFLASKSEIGLQGTWGRWTCFPLCKVPASACGQIRAFHGVFNWGLSTVIRSPTNVSITRGFEWVHVGPMWVNMVEGT
jgi:hypothetical protein